MSIFRPSSRVRLTMRTEEYADTAKLERRLPPQPSGLPPYAAAASLPPPSVPQVRTTQDVADALRRNEEDLRTLARQRADLPVEEWEAKHSALIRERESIQTASEVRVRLQAGGVRPVSVAGTPPDDLTVVGDIGPLGVSITRNGLNTASTATVELSYTDAPFDPRTLRACHVEVILGVVPAENFEAGIERGARRSDGSLTSVVGREEDGSIIGATRFVGFVDEWTVKYSEDGDTVTLECRDMSAPLRDINLNPGQSIDLSEPIDRGIQQLLNTIPTTAGVVVRFAGEGDAPVPSQAAPSKRYPRRGRDKRRGRRGDQNMSLWDHLTDVVAALGFVPQVRDFEVVIAEPATLFSTEGVRRMVYGQNLEELQFVRRLQGVKVPTIEVRSYDASVGRTRWARYPVRDGERSSGVFGVDNPPRPLRANEVTPSGANPTETIRVMTVTGIHDPTTLQRVARNAFEQIGRQEIEGGFSTSEVSSYDRPPDAADLLLALPGDAVEVLVVSAPPPGGEGAISTLAEMQAFTRQRRADYLRGLGWPEAVARRFAALQEATSFQTVFRVLDVRLEYDSDQGIKVAVNFMNYVVVREERTTRIGRFGASL